LIIPGRARPAILVAVQALESCLGKDDVREWRPKDLNDFGPAALVSADPALVGDTDFLPAPVGYQVQQVAVITARQVSTRFLGRTARRTIDGAGVQLGDGSASAVPCEVPEVLRSAGICRHRQVLVVCVLGVSW
jgi:hypothetical protein